MMLVFENEIDLTRHLKSERRDNKKIGFVPTMGALHEGHLSLLQKAVSENDLVVISIFVNPIQFTNPEDLKKYPRTLESDLQKIKKTIPNCIVFTPNAETIFQNRVTTKKFSFNGLENQMEGKFRPGHFNGVAIIVSILFEIIEPTNAYFGEKDFQQLAIVKKLVEKSNISTNIIGCPIVREGNGLAMSSRNERLSSSAREKSALIFDVLKATQQLYPTNSLLNLHKYVSEKLNHYPEFTLEYFEISNENTLKTAVRKSKKTKQRAFIAVIIENIRLIDNISLN